MLGYSLLLMVVRCIPIGVNEVKMRIGLNRLRSDIYCLHVICCFTQIECIRLNTDVQKKKKKSPFPE